MPVAVALKGLTQTIPIVATAGDPIGQGLVTSFAHPGGNVAVVANGGVDFEAKDLSLLAEAVPRAKRVAYLTNGVGGQFTSAQQGYVDSVTSEAPDWG